MKYLLTICCLIITISLCKAIDNDSSTIKNNILFFKDPRIDVLQKMYSRNVSGPKKQNIRVQVFQAQARSKIFDAKAQFSSHFPGIVTYVSYASPNFKLRAGDFETKQEAFKFLQQVKSLFPASFVIEEKGNEENKKPK